MLVCPACHSHVRVDDPTCPFCSAAITTTSAPRSTMLGATALTAGLTMLGCATDPAPTDAGGDSTTAISSTGTGTGTGTSTDTSADTSTDAGTDTDTSTSADTSTDWAEDAAYGVPESPCDDFGPEPVVTGDNAIEVVAEFSEIYQTCGGVGTASLYAFTAPADGDYEFAVVDADFNAVLSLIGYFCSPVEEIACALPPEALTQSLLANDVVHVAVDNADMQAAGLATLRITPL